jgi:hypothetical protein
VAGRAGQDEESNQAGESLKTFNEEECMAKKRDDEEERKEGDEQPEKGAGKEEAGDAVPNHKGETPAPAGPEAKGTEEESEAEVSVELIGTLTWAPKKNADNVKSLEIRIVARYHSEAIEPLGVLFGEKVRVKLAALQYKLPLRQDQQPPAPAEEPGPELPFNGPVDERREHLKALETQLEAAVAEDKLEEAAKLRDEIEQLRKAIEGGEAA